MKKSLSLLLAVALVLSMFGPVAFAAEQTTQEKFAELVEAGIFKGVNEQGDAALDQNMNRAQFARVAALILGLEGIGEPDSKEVTEMPFSDVELGLWYTEEIAAAKEAGIMVGNPDGTFNPTGDITVEQLAVVVAAMLGLEPVEGATVEGAADWAAVYIQAIVDSGIAFPTNYKEAATRAQLVELAYVANEQINGGVVAGDLAVDSIAQSGAKKITVSFNRALTDAEANGLTYDVKYGFVPYSATVNYADDKASAELEFAFLPAGDYTVEVKGFEAQDIKVEAEKVTAIEIGAKALQKAAGQDLKVKALNQWSEEMAGQLGDGNVSIYNGSKARDLKTHTVGGTPVYANFVLDLSDDTSAEVNDNIIVTVTHPNTGLSANKTYQVTAASSVSSMTFGPVVPKEGESRITVEDEGVEIPYTLVDQFGDTIELADAPANNEHGDLTFYSSDNDIVNPVNFKVEDGKLIITRIGTKAGTAIITVLNSKAGITTTFNITVADTAKVKTFIINHPGSLIADGDNVKIPFQATDTFGAPIDQKEFGKAATNSQVSISSGNPGVEVAASWDSKTGELSLLFKNSGNTTIYAWVDGQIASQFSVNVQDAASAEKVTGIKDVNTLFAPGGTFTLEFDKHINAVDNYGRPLDSHAFTATVKEGNVDVVRVDGGNQIVAVAPGTRTIEVTLIGVAGSTYEFSVKVIEAKDVVGFEVESLGVLYSNPDNDPGYEKTITLVGKDSNGKKVNIDQSSFFSTVTSSNLGVATTTVAGAVYGVDKGTATISVWKGAEKIAETEVTVSDAAPVATTVKFDEEEVTVAEGNNENLAALLVIEDQYGVGIAADGTWASSDIGIATVNAVGQVTGVDAGEATISFVTSNGVVATILVTVTE